MTIKSLILLIITFLLTFTCYAQEGKYSNFHDYLTMHCKPSETVLNQCGWQLAMVKLKTNKQGRVISYSFINQASDSLKVAFRPLLGYRFPVKLKMQNKTFVFAQTFYNLLNNCIKTASPDAQNAFEITYQCFIEQLKVNSKTIFDDITMSYISNDETIIDTRHRQ